MPLAERFQGPRRGVDHHLHQAIADELNIPVSAVEKYTIDRRSLDARRKPDLLFRYRLNAQVTASAVVEESEGVSVSTGTPNRNDPLYHLDLSEGRPRTAIVVGTGPAGIMAASL